MNTVAVDWRPTAPIAHIRKHAVALKSIREFFAQQNVLEVSTPLMGFATATDTHLASICVDYHGPGNSTGQPLYLQTSPEFAMKRLLASGSGPIYQVAKAFRNSERGARHNPEFTMLEWYRPGFSLLDLIDEVEQLVRYTSAALGKPLKAPPFNRLTYQDAFAKATGVNPHHANVQVLKDLAVARGLEPFDETDRNFWLDLLFSTLVEPILAKTPTFIYDYPASQAALAKVCQRPDGIQVAERFELYWQGLELANGYHELQNPTEQQSRFDADLAARKRLDLPSVQPDKHLVSALQAGLPACSGVAMGVDRLLMASLELDTIDAILAFPIERA